VTSGTCPGDKDEKLGAWMQPIFDNLTYLLSTRSGPNQSAESRSPSSASQAHGDGKLVLEPLTYIRGRSIPHQFMIVDEAQNLTPHEVKTIVSRVGEGTKIVLTGDIGQIDNPYLDRLENGLSYTVERMKGKGSSGTSRWRRASARRSRASPPICSDRVHRRAEPVRILPSSRTSTHADPSSAVTHHAPPPASSACL
jgi:predicted ribonuclease YlaK